MEPQGCNAAPEAPAMVEFVPKVAELIREAGFGQPWRIPPRGGEPVQPAPRCEILITHPAGRPDLPQITLQGGACAENPEVALAILLAALLKSNLPAIPR